MQYDHLTEKDRKKKLKLHGISVRNFWSTPWHVYNALDDEFDFDLDAAATESTAKCAQWLGLDHPVPGRRNALDPEVRWPGKRVFLNPPYSPDGGGLLNWVIRARIEVNHCQHVVLLLPGTADTAWAEFLWTEGAELRFTPRIAFEDPLYEMTNSPKRLAPMGGSLVCVLRPNQVSRSIDARAPDEERIVFGYAPWAGEGR